MRVERKGDLSLNQTAVLGRLHQFGPLTPGEIAAQLRMLPQSLTRTLAALEAAGLAARSPDPSDGRQSLLMCTRAGAAALRAEMRSRARWLARAAAATLTDEEWAQLRGVTELLDRLAGYDADVAAVER
jgi:DNA-binding MarR family transcriptional regulator